MIRAAALTSFAVLTLAAIAAPAATVPPVWIDRIGFRHLDECAPIWRDRDRHASHLTGWTCTDDAWGDGKASVLASDSPAAWVHDDPVAAVTPLRLTAPVVPRPAVSRAQTASAFAFASGGSTVVAHPPVDVPSPVPAPAALLLLLAALASLRLLRRGKS